MALNTQFITDDYKAARTDLSTTITVAAANYTAVVGDVERGRLFSDAGFLGDDVVPCVILKADFTTVPGNGTKVTIGGVVYRVESWVDDPAGKCRNLNLVEDD